MILAGCNFYYYLQTESQSWGIMFMLKKVLITQSV